MNTGQVVEEWYGPEGVPTNVNVAWGWDNDKAHKPAHYEMLYQDFLSLAKRFKNPNLFSKKIDYNGFQILHFNTNTDQLYGTVRKWVWDPKSMQRQLMDLVFTMSRTELVIEYRGNNRPGTITYRLSFDPGNLKSYGDQQNWQRHHDGRMHWVLVQDTTPRPISNNSFPLEGKQFVKWLSRNIASVNCRLNGTSSANLTWLLGVLNCWQAKDVMGSDDFEQLRAVAKAYDEVMHELGLSQYLELRTVVRLLRALESLTKADTPKPGIIWAEELKGKMIQVTLDPDDPNPSETVAFLVEEYRKERFPGVAMDVIDRISKGPHLG